jgi:hypothetical protein
MADVTLEAVDGEVTDELYTTRTNDTTSQELTKANLRNYKYLTDLQHTHRKATFSRNPSLSDASSQYSAGLVHLSPAPSTAHLGIKTSSTALPATGCTAVTNE